MWRRWGSIQRTQFNNCNERTPTQCGDVDNTEFIFQMAANNTSHHDCRALAYDTETTEYLNSTYLNCCLNSQHSSDTIKYCYSVDSVPLVCGVVVESGVEDVCEQKHTSVCLSALTSHERSRKGNDIRKLKWKWGVNDSVWKFTRTLPIAAHVSLCRQRQPWNRSRHSSWFNGKRKFAANQHQAISFPSVGRNRITFAAHVVSLVHFSFYFGSFNI